MHPYEQFLPTPILHQRILFFAAALYTLGILFGTAYTAPAWLFVLLAGAFLLLGCLLNRGGTFLHSPMRRCSASVCWVGI